MQVNIKPILKVPGHNLNIKITNSREKTPGEVMTLRRFTEKKVSKEESS
jgi:hypothetical protein